MEFTERCGWPILKFRAGPIPALRFECKRATGEKKPWPCRIEKCEWMYTEPYRKAQNGNRVKECNSSFLREAPARIR